MIPTVVIKKSEYAPALQDKNGKIITAPFTTCDEEYALEYAKFAASKNQHDDRNNVLWPKRYILGDIN